MADKKRKRKTQGSAPLSGTEHPRGQSPDGQAGSAIPMPELECPPELPPLAREEWNRIVGELIALGVLSKFDRGPLAVYCGAYAMWAEGIEALQAFGTMIKSPTGYPVQSPWVAIVNLKAGRLVRIASECGFTPASRSRNVAYSKGISMLIDATKDRKDEFGP